MDEFIHTQVNDTWTNQRFVFNDSKFIGTMIEPVSPWHGFRIVFNHAVGQERGPRSPFDVYKRIGMSKSCHVTYAISFIFGVKKLGLLSRHGKLPPVEGEGQSAVTVSSVIKMISLAFPWLTATRAVEIFGMHVVFG